jgi:hypothetical protein
LEKNATQLLQHSQGDVAINQSQSVFSKLKEVYFLLMQTDSKTLAYVNLFAVLGTLENLCELAPEAKSILKGKEPFSIGFAVKGGPQAVLAFKNGHCELREGSGGCTILLPFPSCEKFNGMINGTYSPMPSKGLLKLALLTKTFVPLTEVLKNYLKPSKTALQNPSFREISTRLMLYTAAAAVSQVGNNDKSGMVSASQIPDGDIAIDVKNVMGITVSVKNHRLTTVKQPCRNPRSSMVFSSLDVAGQLLSGEVSAMACISNGSIEMHGMLNMIDNMNRILDRVAQYLS